MDSGHLVKPGSPAIREVVPGLSWSSIRRRPKYPPGFLPRSPRYANTSVFSSNESGRSLDVC